MSLRTAANQVSLDGVNGGVRGHIDANQVLNRRSYTYTRGEQQPDLDNIHVDVVDLDAVCLDEFSGRAIRASEHRSAARIGLSAVGALSRIEGAIASRCTRGSRGAITSSRT